MGERVRPAGRPPNLFLIGAQKGGSSTLARHLMAHPDIRFYSIKEPHFFRGAQVGDCRVALQSQPAPETDEAYYLDASVDYARFPLVPHVARNILEICGPHDPRFIYILRHPLDRAVSEYFWKRERYGEYRPIEEALSAESQYVATSRYDLQIAQYLEHFDRASFHFVKFDDYFADINAGYADLCAWLKIAVRPVADRDLVRGATDKAMTKEARFSALNRIAYASPRLRAALKSVMPHRVLRRATNLLSKPVSRDAIPAELKARAQEQFFADSIETTERLTGLDLSDWKAGG